MKLLSIIITFLIIGCSARISGGPGGQTTNGIVMAAYDIDGTPVANASVSVRRSDFMYGDPQRRDSLDRVDELSGTTDNDGVLQFNNVIPGHYLIEITEGESYAVVDTVTVGEELLDKGDLNLHKTGAIAGTISTEYIALFDSVAVVIRGTDRATSVGASGEFEFTGLAPWKYTFTVCGYNSDTVAVEEDKEVTVISDTAIEITAGEILNVAQYTAVRLFMDSCGLQSTAVSEVAGVTSGEINSLSLTNKAITKIPSNVNELVFLKTLQLDSNSIRVIPEEISALNSLLTLSLSANKIDSIPFELSDCIALTTLNLDHNQLISLDNLLSTLSSLKSLSFKGNKVEKLPASITRMSFLTFLDGSNNRISELPEEMKESYVMLLDVDFNHNNINTDLLSVEFRDWLTGLHGSDDSWLTTQSVN